MFVVYKSLFSLKYTFYKIAINASYITEYRFKKEKRALIHLKYTESEINLNLKVNSWHISQTTLDWTYCQCWQLPLRYTSNLVSTRQFGQYSKLSHNVLIEVAKVSKNLKTTISCYPDFCFDFIELVVMSEPMWKSFDLMLVLS